MSAEKDGGVTAKALIPAAFLEAKPSRIRVGIKRNPGPTPSKPDRIEMGTARIKAALRLPRAVSFASPSLASPGLSNR
jgi:hypothetical protein